MARAQPKRRQTGPQGLFADGRPVRLSDLHLVADGEPDLGDRRDGPTPTFPKPDGGDSSDRLVKGKRLTPTGRQQIINDIVYLGFWEQVEYLQAELDRWDDERSGRSRLNTAAELLAYRQIEKTLGYMDRADNEIRPNPNAGRVTSIWVEVQRALENAWPDNPERRLGNNPPNRSRFTYFRNRFLTEERLDRIGDILTDNAVEAAEHAEILQRRNSRAHPGYAQLAFGDAVWARGKYNPGTKKLRDDDAAPIPRPGKSPEDDTEKRELGHLGVWNFVRAREPNEIIPLTVSIKNQDGPSASDGRIAVDDLLNARERHSLLQDCVEYFAYDMSIRSREHDDLLEAGIIGLSHVPRFTHGRPAARNLGSHEFRRGDQVVTELPVTAIDGSPTVTFIDGLGDDWAMPLSIKEVQKTPRKRKKKKPKTDVYGIWQLSDDPIVPAELRGTTVRIRHNSTKRERKTGGRRTIALRVRTRHDPIFQDLYGARENAESSFNHIKSKLVERRVNIVGRLAVLGKFHAFQHSMITTALINYANRTETDISKWFGNHIPPPEQRVTQFSRAGPLLQLAA